MDQQRELGQYMTPEEIAQQMCNLFQTPLAQLKVLDPACGDGSLLLAVANELLKAGVEDVAHRLVGVDIDSAMLSAARSRLRAVLGSYADDVLLIHGDFLALSGNTLFGSGLPADLNAVISNPPYGKLREYKFFDACCRRLGPRVEKVFLMPLAFIDRVSGISTTILPGRPMGVTTGHAIVYHRNDQPYRIRPTGGMRSNTSGFTVLTGVKLYEIGGGDPPQTREVVAARPFTSTTSREGWLPCLRTGDVHPFRVTTGRLYVDYGPHLGQPKDIGRFVGPKILVRRMPIWGDRSLGAAYVEDTVLCAGDVLVVRHVRDDRELLRGLEAFLNSPKAAQLMHKIRPTLLHRTSYPKMSAKDLNLLFETALPSEAELRSLALRGNEQATGGIPMTASHDGSAGTNGGVCPPGEVTSKPHCYLETEFPVAEVSAACQREKSVRQGHLSTLQMWWARRPLAVARTAVFAALCPPAEVIDAAPSLREALDRALPGDDAARDKLPKLTGQLAQWESRTDWHLLRSAGDLIRLAKGHRPLVVDTFAGGGSIPLEALRLGLDAYAGELNPVAGTALRAVVEMLPGLGHQWLQEFVRVTARLEERICAATSRLYGSPGRGTPLAFLWSRTYDCPGCGVAVPLLRDKWLAKGSRGVGIRLSAQKGARRFQVQILAPVESCETPGLDAGTVRASGAECPLCGKPVTTKWLRDKGMSRSIGEQLYAIYVQMPDGTRRYVEPTADDQRVAETCKLRSIRGRKHKSVPDEEFDLNGIRHTWACQYGVRSTGDLYSRRQGRALLEVLHEIEDVRRGLSESGLPQEVKRLYAVLLALMFNRLVLYGTRHSWWQSDGQFPASMFGRQAIPMVWNYAEIPVNSPGAAGFASARKWLLKVVAELAQIPRSGTVQIADASCCSVADGQADLVAIDPPYYDSIAYSYLSDVFYVWMRALIGEEMPAVFDTPLTPKAEEAIVDRPHSLAPHPKDDGHFRRKMREALAEAKRVLRPDGMLLVMYGHKKPHAWSALIDSLIEAGFGLVASWPVHMERKVKFRHGRVSALTSSCLILCAPQPRSIVGQITAHKFYEILGQFLADRISRYSELGVLGDDLATSLLAPACSLLSDYDVRLESGEPLDVGRLLQDLPDLIRSAELNAVSRDLREGTTSDDIRSLVEAVVSAFPRGLRTVTGQSWYEWEIADPIVRQVTSIALEIEAGNGKDTGDIVASLSAEERHRAVLVLRLAVLGSSDDARAYRLAETTLVRLAMSSRFSTAGAE